MKIGSNCCIQQLTQKATAALEQVKSNIALETEKLVYLEE